MPRIYLRRLAVPDDVIDVNRHVNNLAYLRWMQDVATAHSVVQGWPLERYLGIGAGWFVRSHFIEYLRPAFAGDALAIRTWVADIAARSSTRRYLFVRESDGQHVARAETLWVWVDFASGRPARIPGEVVASFPIVADDDPEVTALGAGARRRGD
jgi:acyl-CoA thioester hydrolase